PKYNAALRFLDEGLATAKDMDTTCRLGLGYADGPIERVERGGLGFHHDVTRALFETYGTPGYAPAPRAVVAKARETSECVRSPAFGSSISRPCCLGRWRRCCSPKPAPR